MNNNNNTHYFTPTHTHTHTQCIIEIISLTRKIEKKDKRMQNHRLLRIARRNISKTYNGYGKH